MVKLHSHVLTILTLGSVQFICWFAFKFLYNNATTILIKLIGKLLACEWLLAQITQCICTVL